MDEWNGQGGGGGDGGNASGRRMVVAMIGRLIVVLMVRIWLTSADGSKLTIGLLVMVAMCLVDQ